MDFKIQYLRAMQAQNLKMYRRLKAAGELERFVELKANEAQRLFRELTQNAPKAPGGYPRLPWAREAEEQVLAMMLEFPDDSATERLPLLLLDDPPPFATLETWEQFLAEVEALPNFQGKVDKIVQIKRVIFLRETSPSEFLQTQQ